MHTKTPFAALALLAAAAQAQTADWAESQRILPAEPAFLQGTGRAIAVDGARMALGDPADDEGSSAGAGSVSWFQRGGELYTLQARLRAPTIAPGDFYGSALDLQGAVLAVGAPGRESGVSQDNGEVLVYALAAGGATLSATLAGPPADNAQFGAALSLDQGRLAVGAPGEDGGRGAVYVYGSLGGAWTLVQRLQPAELVVGDQYGASVSLRGNRLVVGAPQRTAAGLLNAGSAYVYDQSLLGWLLAVRSDGAAADARLGASLAQDASRVVVGAPGANLAQVWTGGLGSYALETTLAGSVPASSFGAAVALKDGLLAVGAPDDSTIVFQSGSVRLHALGAGGWSGIATLRAGGFQTLYGSALDLGDDLVLGGAPGMFGAGYFSVGGGVVHEPRLQRLCSGPSLPCPCGAGARGCVNSAGQSARLDGVGSTSLAADGLTLEAGGVTRGFTAFLQSTERGGPSPFGDGVLCLGATPVRLGTVEALNGIIQLPGVGGPSISTLGGVTTPGPRVYQAWYRDGAPGYCTSASFNATDALRIVWRP